MCGRERGCVFAQVRARMGARVGADVHAWVHACGQRGTHGADPLKLQICGRMLYEPMPNILVCNIHRSSGDATMYESIE